MTIHMPVYSRSVLLKDPAAKKGDITEDVIDRRERGRWKRYNTTRTNLRREKIVSAIYLLSAYPTHIQDDLILLGESSSFCTSRSRSCMENEKRTPCDLLWSCIPSPERRSDATSSSAFASSSSCCSPSRANLC